MVGAVPSEMFQVWLAPSTSRKVLMLKVPLPEPVMPPLICRFCRGLLVIVTVPFPENWIVLTAAELVMFGVAPALLEKHTFDVPVGGPA